MTSDELVHITAALIDSGRSERGGWTKAQLAILGVRWPPPAGWKTNAISRMIAKADAERFVQLRGNAQIGGTS